MEEDNARRVQEHTPGEDVVGGNYSVAQGVARVANRRGDRTQAKESSGS